MRITLTDNNLDIEDFMTLGELKVHDSPKHFKKLMKRKFLELTLQAELIQKGLNAAQD